MSEKSEKLSNIGGINILPEKGIGLSGGRSEHSGYRGRGFSRRSRWRARSVSTLKVFRIGVVDLS